MGHNIAQNACIKYCDNVLVMLPVYSIPSLWLYLSGIEQRM